MTAKQSRWRSLIAVGGILLLCVAVSRASAGETEDRIRKLEADQQANAEELARLKGEQMELKKEATAAAAALPTFEYRPGRGLTITAADRSWSLNTAYELHIVSYNNLKGKPVIRDPAGGTRRSTGMTSGEFFGRRNRVYWTFCLNNCFYEYTQALDMDTEDITAQQISEFNIHLEKVNPYLPILVGGLEAGASRGAWAPSTGSDTKAERGMAHDGSVITVTGRHRGVGFVYNRVPVGPGDVTAELHYTAGRLGTSDNETADTDKKGIIGLVSTRPFSHIKNKWISGLDFGLHFQATSIDGRAGLTESPAANTEDDRIRIRSEQRRGRVTLFDANNIGSGPSIYFFPGLRWTIGPYALFGNYSNNQVEGKNDAFRGVRLTGFQMTNQVFLWSPKGFLTGSAATPGSVQIGWTFQRADGECGRASSGVCVGTTGAGTDVQRNRVLSSELGIYYYLAQTVKLGFWWMRYDSSNTPARTQVAVGCANNITAANAGKGAGRGCEWDAINMGVYSRW